MIGNRIVPIFVAIGLFFIMVSALEISIGPVSIPVQHLIGEAWGYFHGMRTTDAVVVGAVRLPRWLAAVMIGAGLGSTGAVMQALFRNPMADPAIIGVSSGASLGAVIVIQSGLSQLSQWSTPLGAFTSGIIVVFVIYQLSTYKGRTAIYSLLLAGVAISSFCSAIVTLLLSLAQLETMHEMLFWLIGGLDGITWPSVGIVSIVVLLGLGLYTIQAPSLDIISIGEEQAEGVGVPLQRTKRFLFIISALVVGACVSVSGVIGFIGLIVPHLLRMVVGPRHQLLIPASALGGASLLCLCDVIARMVFEPVELNVGIVTACLGAPFFLYLLRKQDRGIYREEG